MNEKFISLRKKYYVFNYNGFNVSKGKSCIDISFDFEIEGLCSFKPTIKVMTDNLNVINSFDSETARKMIFSLGMVEAVSYWKCACPKTIKVKCGYLSEEDKRWWKKLYYNGLGEFFYRNSIETDFDSFVNIENSFLPESVITEKYNKSGINIIPVGGGKDSNVTMELLKAYKADNMCFTVNNQAARTQCAEAAGYDEDKIIKTFRTIDKNLLERNKEGFLNGHTPFSAIVAFLSLYCAYITGAGNIALSNEASANEANINGTGINHQYSKSYEFECDFNSYVKNHFLCDIKYFSLLRAFNELQIAKQFAQLKKYHKFFKSCNVGSKKNVWCCMCAKCLFVYIILSPFLTENELESIFGCNMLDKTELESDFMGLTGMSSVKPFECIGTVSEVNCAVELTIKKYKSSQSKLPKLLKVYDDAHKASKNKADELLSEFNKENNIPPIFLKPVLEMYKYVSESD